MEFIRVENDEQLKQAFEIRFEVFVKEQGVPEHIEIDEYDASPTSCRHFLIRSEGLPIATGRITDYGEGVAKMQRIAVLKPYRGTGIGQLLMERMEEDARKAGYRYALLDAQCAAETFYQKQGYMTESKEPFLDAGILHVRMRKSL
ncbi:GNAT family N-acetyltransferase [Cohnella boryungensis]|uniref:GNAT family N-acetyltransferase n=1 Tax=Cohnella boryungensis TaxID=768479 RepID=A0ABV8SJ71_9BACL